MGDPLYGVMVLTSSVGGAGVSTMTLTLGSKLAQEGARVLMVDLDPSKGLHRLCGVPLEADGADVPPEKVRSVGEQVLRTDFERLFLLSWDAGAPPRPLEQELTPLEALRADYDVILIDASRRLPAEVDASLAMADSVLLVQPIEPLAIRQLEGILERIAKVKDQGPDSPLFLGVVMNRVRTEAPMFDLMVKELQQSFGPLLCRTVIPEDPWWVESALRAMPLPELLPEAAGALASSRLLDELRGRRGP